MNSVRRSLGVVAGLALAGLMGGTACLAAAAPSTQARFDRFDGLWETVDSMLFNLAPIGASEDPETPTPPLKGEYLRRFEENAARLRSVANGPPPGAAPGAGTGPEPNAPAVVTGPRPDVCGKVGSFRGFLEPSMPGMMTGSQGAPMEVISAKGRLYFYNVGRKQLRRIYVDGRSHPAPDDVVPNLMGHSIGRWEGNDLVVDTTGFLEGPLDGQTCHSDAFHIVERMRFRDPNTLEIVITLTDPKALTVPWSSTRIYRRLPIDTVLEPQSDFAGPQSDRHF